MGFGIMVVFSSIWGVMSVYTIKVQKSFTKRDLVVIWIKCYFYFRMKKFLVYLILLLCAVYITGYFSDYRPLLPGYHAFFYTEKNYRQVKTAVQKKKQQLKPGQVEEARALFTTILTKELFPYWYGTRWAFYGDTEVPGDGSIACGYFVTTVLRDAGVKLNRIALAQCASEQMIRTLIHKPYIHHYNQQPFAQFIASLKKQGVGYYIIGLDNHTGFIQVTPNAVRFIHSSGRWPFAVVNEDAETSVVLKHSAYKVTGLLTSKEFLQYWIAHK